jgi:formylglycine-generating enzyme required for sulfatase activity
LNNALSDGSVKLVDNQIVGFYPGDKFNNGRHEEEIKAGDYIYIQVDHPALRLSFTGELFSALETWQNHPMTMVSWFGAKAYCEYYGWRLPTAMEWEKAARGTDIRPFPWGFELARNNANFIFSRDPFEDMSTFGSRTTPVGFYNGGIYDGYQTLDSASPYGIYDMAGNVWQWTGDIYDQQHYRYMRGGSKDLYQNNLRIWVSNNATPTYTSPGVGFRCAR